MTPVEARLLFLVAELRRDWAAVTAHRDRASSVQATQGAVDVLLRALADE